MSSPEENKAIIRRWLEEGWTRGNLAVADELIDPGFVVHGAGGQAVPIEPHGVKQLVSAWCMGFPDGRMIIDDLIAEGDKVAVRNTWVGTSLFATPGGGRHAHRTPPRPGGDPRRARRSDGQGPCRGGPAAGECSAAKPAVGAHELADDRSPLTARARGDRERLEADLETAATVLNAIALYRRARAAYAEAEPLYKRSILIFEKALGPDHPDVAAALNNLAELYRNQGKYDLAEPLYKRSIPIFEKALGPDHPLVATALNNLALLYQAQGKYDLAEPLYKRSLAIREKALGPDHPLVATALNNLALLYQAQGKYDLAEPLYKRSLAIRLFADCTRSRSTNAR